MFRYRKPILLACLLGAMVLTATALGVSAFAKPLGLQAPPVPAELAIGPGATLSILTEGNGGDINQPGDGNGDAPAASSTEQFNFGLKATTTDHSILMGLGGGAISLCTVHGPSADLDFATESGNFPLQQMQCGRAFGMDVVFDRCAVNLEFHGFVHSDRSTRIYFGPMTADVEFRKTGANTGTMRVTIFTPKAPIVLNGRVQSPTPILLSTCPV